MKIHEKAKLYDELLKDYIELMNDIQSFKKDLEDIPNREDLIPLKESNIGFYYASVTGSFSAMPTALDMKMWKHNSNLKFYQNVK
jgi:hypothetical protein